MEDTCVVEDTREILSGYFDDAYAAALHHFKNADAFELIDCLPPTGIEKPSNLFVLKMNPKIGKYLFIRYIFNVYCVEDCKRATEDINDLEKLFEEYKKEWIGDVKAIGMEDLTGNIGNLVVGIRIIFE